MNFENSHDLLSNQLLHPLAINSRSSSFEDGWQSFRSYSESSFKSSPGNSPKSVGHFTKTKLAGSLIKQGLLNETNFTISAKIIKKICASGDQVINIKKGNGLNMIIESYGLISCKVIGDTLYINSYPVPVVSKWFCCSLLTKRKKFEYSSLGTDNANYSETWTINAIFIVGTIECTESGILVLNEGFDKSLYCTNDGNGLILINNLNVVNLTCNVKDNAKIKMNDSMCANFNGEAFGNGYIKTPTVTKTFKCKVYDKCTIDVTKYDKCTTDTYVSKHGKLRIVDLFNV